MASRSKPCRVITLRIDEIPDEKSHDALKYDIECMINQDSDLKRGVASVLHHHLVRREGSLACATASFKTSIPKDELVERLNQASDFHGYWFDADFKGGIIPLYEFPMGAEADVIAVPGLASHALGSWKSPLSNDVWLRDYLPQDIQHIRVLVYGYDTSLLDCDAKDTIETLGKRLLEAIKAARGESAKYRPIILIGHSLGGLLIKEALVHARKKLDDPQNVNFYKACHGLLFFGVPNLGLRQEQLLSIVRGRPTELLVRDLVVDNDSEPSPFLKRISAEFSECCREGYKVVSFFELKKSQTVRIRSDGTLDKTGPMILLVTEKSATCTGLTAAMDENNISLPKDHTGLVKFERRTQEEYSIVKEKLKALIGEAKIEVSKRFQQGRLCTPDTQLTKDCLQSLAFICMDDRSNDIDDEAEGTCQWLLNHERYQKWLHERGSLWISGKPGSGKSTLLKYALRRYQEEYDRETLVVPFFFHGRGSDLQKSPLGFFRALLHRLLDLVPGEMGDLVDRFRYYKDTKGMPGEKWHWHLNELKNLFITSYAKILQNSTVVLFIDALDECGEDNAVDLVKIFTRLTNDHPKLGICFTCRHYPILPFGGRLNICVEHENNGDINKYVQTQLSMLNNESMATLPIMITGRACGVFMWARLVVARVEQSERSGATQDEIEKEIQRTPEKLEDLYDTLIRGMNDKVNSLKLMQWICFATRPLSVEELRWAMIIEVECELKTLQQYKKAKWYIRDRNMMEKRIKSLSCGLAEIVPTSNVVQFIHESVREFFIDKGLFILGSRMSSTDLAIGEAHYRLSRICLHYLALQEIVESNTGFLDTVVFPQFEAYREKRHLLFEFPLLGYTTVSWVVHTRKSETNGIPRENLWELFSWPSASLVRPCPHFGHLIKRFKDVDWRGKTIVHLVSMYGLSGLLRRLLNVAGSDYEIDQKDINGRTPLSYAVESGGLTRTKLLLESGTVDINSSDKNGYTPLAFAASHGNYDAVKLLLSTDKVNVNSRDNMGRTPLSLAVEYGRHEVVKLLLSTGQVDVNLGDNDRCALMLLAAQDGPCEAVKLLLGTDKFDINSRDNNGRTLLSLAAKAGTADVIKLLLGTKRVNINSRDKTIARVIIILKP